MSSSGKLLSGARGTDPDAGGAGEYLELTDDVIMTVADGTIRWVSPSWARLTGLARSELVGRSPSEFVHPDDLQDLPFDRNGPGPRHRARLREGRDGWRWFEHRFTARWADDGSVESFLVHSRDIGEQVELEQRLADSERRLRVALDALPDGFAIHRVARDAAAPVPARVPAPVPAPRHPVGDAPGPTNPALVYVNPAGAASLASTPEHLRHALLDVARHGKPRRLRTAVPVEDGPDRIYESYVAPLDHDLVLSTWRDVTDAERAREALEDQRQEAEYRARHDGLTGLPNRVLLNERLGMALEQARRGELVGVVFCDLDGFKQVNDRYGHAAGDRVLQAVATRLAQSLGSHDTAARLAGDEFVVVLHRLPGDWQPEPFLDRLVGALCEPVVAGDTVLRPAASLGLVLVDPVDGPPEHRDPQQVLALADRTMYVSKASGRPVVRPVTAAWSSPLPG